MDLSCITDLRERNCFDVLMRDFDENEVMAKLNYKRNDDCLIHK